MISRWVGRLWEWKNSRNDPLALVPCDACDLKVVRIDALVTQDGKAACSEACRDLRDAERAW